MVDEVEQGYTWETEYERTWEVLQEDEAGSLKASIDDVVQKAKRRKQLSRPLNVRLGMMRYLFLVLDMSTGMEDPDLKPSRLIASLKILEHFVEEYFDQNPISQLGIIAMRNKRADMITDLGGNPRRHTVALIKLKDQPCQGEPSLQNAFELAADSLKGMPGHASREILVVFGSLSTCDPGDIHDTVKMLKSRNVRCSIIGLAADVHVCRKICAQTQGKYDVILDESHFRDLLCQHMAPPAAANTMESSMIRMGFPRHETQAAGDSKPSMCLCHLDSQSASQCFGKGGYFCPQCCAKYCSLPVECLNCGLQLVSAPHLARSYHHLFPLETFPELTAADVVVQRHKYCYSCLKPLSGQNAYQCPRCKNVFCIDCDVFIHESLHTCPGCASSRSTQSV